VMGIFQFGEQRPSVIFLFRGRLDGSVSCERVCIFYSGRSLGFGDCNDDDDDRIGRNHARRFLMDA